MENGPDTPYLNTLLEVVGTSRSSNEKPPFRNITIAGVDSTLGIQITPIDLTSHHSGSLS